MANSVLATGGVRPSSGSRVALSPRRLAIFLLAMAYALVLVNLPLLAFRDRTFYLEYYAPYSDQILQRKVEQGLLPLLANEPAWLLLNIALASVLQPEDVVRVFIFVPAFVVAWVLLRSKPQHIFWLVFILLYPAVIKNHIIHVRQGVAIAIFLVGVLATRHRGLRWILIGVTPFIHSSFFFVIGIMLLAHLSRRLRFAADLSMFVFVLATAAALLSVEWVASAVGARQAAEYQLLDGTAVSGINFIFWGVMLGIMTMEGKDYLRRHRFEVAAVILYLGTYFFTPITARVFESVLPLVLIAGAELTQWRGLVFKLAIVVFGVVMWITGYALGQMLL
jgi:hypothetical protein